MGINIIKSLEGWDFLNAYGSYYFEKENISLDFYTDLIVVTNLANAQKPGKTCSALRLWYRSSIGSYDDNIHLKIANAIQNEFYDFLVEAFQNPEYVTSLMDGVEVYEQEYKGISVFSPFHKQKPIKTPKKWTRSHVIKAIYSGQMKHGQCKGKYTDDYAYDAAINYRKGIIDQMEFVKQLIESPSGWRIRQDEEQENLIHVNCYHFDYNQFIFVEGGQQK